MKESLGYDYALCTVDASNRAQVVILAKNGWQHLATFQSTKTEHHVSLWGKDLNV